MPRLPLLPCGIAVLLAACTPPYMDKAHIALAKDYYRSCGPDGCTMNADALTLDQLYAIHLYGRSYHPWRGASGPVAGRGAAAVPFLRAKLAAATDGGEVGSLLDILEAMRRLGSYDVAGDAALVADMQAAAHRVKDPAFFLRDQADEIETGEERPFAVSVSRSFLEGHGKDYDVAFAKNHCRGCDFRDWRAGIGTLPIEQLYALYRWGWENYFNTRNIERLVAERGGEAVPFLKTRLPIVESPLALYNVLSALETMRDLGTYDPAADAELIALAEAALVRLGKKNYHWNADAVERLRTGTRHPQAALRVR